jgi:hypothetical protein
MKIIIFTLMFVFSTCLSAEKPSQEQLLGEAFVDYGNIAGGWYLNERCSFLTEEELTTFNNDVASITVALGKDTSNPKMLAMIQKSAKGVAYNEKFSSCGKEPENIVKQTSSHASAWANQIREIKNEN